MCMTNSINLCLVIHFLCVSNICCLNNVLFMQHYKNNELAQNVAVKIAEKFYSINYPTIVWSKDIIENDPLELFRRRYSGCLLPIEISGNGQFLSKFYSKNFTYHITQYVIYIDHLKDFEYFMDKMKKESWFANYGKLIIVCNDNDTSVEYCNAEMLFTAYWKYHLVNIIFLHQNQAREVTISTYFPMEGVLCNRTKPKIYQIVRKCADYQSVHNLFPEKLNNFNGCPFIISTFISPPFVKMRKDTHGVQIFSGLDGEFYSIICKMINATLKVILGRSGGTLNVTPCAGMFDDLMMQRADYSAFFLLDLNTTRTFRSVYPSWTMSVGWVAPSAPLRPAWEKLIKPFDFLLRISFATFLFVFSLLLVILKETGLQAKWNAYFTKDVLNSNIYINMCSIFFSQGTAKCPKKSALSCCLALWIWFSFFMLNAYQGALISVLKQDDFHSNFDTVSDAIKAGYDFGEPIEARMYFADDPKLYKLFKVIEFEDYDKYMEAIFMGTVKFILYTLLDLLPYIDFTKNHTHSLHVIPNDVKRQYLTNYLQPDSPLEDTLSTMYGRMLASGLIEKIQTEARNFANTESLKRQRSSRSDIPLTMHHMKACFFVVVGGWILSLSVLITELIWHRYKLSKNSKRLSLWWWKI